MLAIEEKDDIDGMVEMMRKMDSTGRMILMSNATVLLARQELAEKEDEPERKKSLNA